MSATTKRGRGRPPLPESERGSAVNAWLSPAELAHVTLLGDGKPTAGVRVAIAESMRRAARRASRGASGPQSSAKEAGASG